MARQIIDGIQFGSYLSNSIEMLPEIEDIIISEINGLCGSCAHFEGCAYRLSTTKVIIQCEVFESGDERSIRRYDDTSPKGLCVNCTQSPFCHLPKDTAGVWHCEEYE